MSRKPDPEGPNADSGRWNERYKQARGYLLANPLASKRQIVLATGLSDSTISRARKDLIAEGKIRGSRKQAPTMKTLVREDSLVAVPIVIQDPPVLVTPKTAPPAAKGGGNTLLDHTAMTKLADMVDKLVEGGDDETVQKMFLKQCITFALRVDLHPDTRSSAMTMWGKLRDMAKAKDLGPGKPKTRADAVRRGADFNRAMGPEIAYEAFCMAFNTKEATNGPSSNEAVAVGGPTEAPSTAGHTSDPAPTNDLRTEQLESTKRGSTSVGDSNPPGPEAGRPGEAGDPRTPTHPHGDNPWS